MTIGILNLILMILYRSIWNGRFIVLKSWYITSSIEKRACGGGTCLLHDFASEKKYLDADIYSWNFEGRVHLPRFFVRGSSRSTFHQTGKCVRRCVETRTYRDELVMKQHIPDIFVGQTLRYIQGIHNKFGTMMVTRISSTTVTGTLECGKNRGETKILLKFEIVEVHEIFGYSLLLQKVKYMN